MQENGISKPEEKLFNCYGENMHIINDGFADVVYSYQVLEHVKNIDEVFRETKRVLKPNGMAYFTMPNYNSFYEGHYEIFWIPFILSKSKFLSKIYLKILKRNPIFIDELNFTTPYNIKRKAQRIFEKGEVFVLPWGVRYFGRFNKYIYAAGLISFYNEVKRKHKHVSLCLENSFPFLAKLNTKTKLKFFGFVSKLILFLFSPFITDFRLIILYGGYHEEYKAITTSSK